MPQSVCWVFCALLWSGYLCGVVLWGSRALQVSCVLRGSAGIYCTLCSSGIFHWCSLVVRHLGLSLQRGPSGPWEGRELSHSHTLPSTVRAGTGLGKGALAAGHTGVAGHVPSGSFMKLQGFPLGDGPLWPLV